LTYDELLIEAGNAGLLVKEKPLKFYDGRIKGRKIAIRQNIPTLTEKACVLAEEMGHYCTNTMDILDQKQVINRKLERAGRLWAYDKLIGLSGIIQGYRAQCRNRHELAECLGVTEDFLQEALDCYKEKYGLMTELDGYLIIFEPALSVIEKLN
jgi:hypothetical protein